ncbi:MAG: Mrp/NBP35 family ATP-binding protein [Phycisphaerae bacterium]|nr:Mrp/NBP35 family ATP-binding protein [Phycisphaerae bacterium]
MTSVTRDQVLDALRRVHDPELRKDLVTLNMVKDIAVREGDIRIGIELTTPACPLKDAIRSDVEREVRRLPGVRSIDIDWTAQVRATIRSQNALPGVKNIIAVGAGKGGVGKSTIAVILAAGLHRSGARVGLLDADVYGPSIPKMVGLENERPSVRGEKILPLTAGGVFVMSMGFMVEPERAVIWRGPMVHGVIKQFLDQVEWGELDYLIVDLPPGTGDVPLTLSQSIPMTGAVVVCTPQDVALLDAIKALRMYQQLNVDILGIVENMSYFIAPDTGKEYDIFGRGGAEKAAARLKVPFLGAIPLNVAIRVGGDTGNPLTAFDETDPATAKAVDAFVRTAAGQVSIRNVLRPAPLDLKIT